MGNRMESGKLIALFGAVEASPNFDKPIVFWFGTFLMVLGALLMAIDLFRRKR